MGVGWVAHDLLGLGFVLPCFFLGDVVYFGFVSGGVQVVNGYG